MYPRKAKRTLYYRGFTLIELAAVLIVIGLITSMGMVATLGAVESARKAATENRMDVIEKALLQFRNQHNRLPCPADPTLTKGNASYGAELRTDDACDLTTPSVPPYVLTDSSDSTTTIEGGVPTSSLGLPAEFMFDGWGRRFMYSIPTTAGETESFSLFITPQSTQCSGAVLDQTLTTRSDGPIYVLTSFGPNGHGAFTDGTTRLDANVTNTEELVNCRCSAAGAFDTTYSAGSRDIRWVQAPVTESTSLANTFDDIVRYKERWQMLNGEDYRKSENYKDVVLAVAYNTATANFWMYKFNGCARDWQRHPSSNFLTPSGATSTQNVFFDRDTIFLYSDSSTAPIQPVYVTRDTLTTSSCVAITDCVPVVAENGTFPIAVSNNHIIAVSHDEAPFLQLYKSRGTDTASPILTPVSTSYALPSAALGNFGVSGTTYGQLTSVFPATPSANAPSFQPSIVVFSKDADYLFLGDKSNYADIYAKQKDDTYRKVNSTYHPTLTANEVKSAAFSPNGRYFAVGTETSAPAISIWKIQDGQPFAASGTNPFTSQAANIAGASLASISFPGDVAPVLAFSPDSKYMVAAGGTSAGTISDVVKIFKINAPDTFVDISSEILGSFATNETVIDSVPIVFTPDSNQFLLAVTHAGGANILEFEKVTADIWRLSAPAVVVFNTTTPAKAMAISQP